MQNFHQISLEDFTSWCKQQGEKPFRAKQVYEWVYQKTVASFEEMTNVSLSFRELLAENFSLNSLEFVKTETSKDEQTVKFLWRLFDGKLVESVLIFAPGRRTVCVSSQVGCPAKCAFCASGREGLLRNLSASEIFEQVYLIELWLRDRGDQEGRNVTNIVYMGMGEPLENYEAVVGSLRMLFDPLKFGFSERRITISTVGVVEGIKKLTKEEIKVNLVLSLHAPNQHVRKKIIPYARRYELSSVLEAIRGYVHMTKRDTTYEYILIAGINDQKEHAVELAELVKNDACTVNLIPYNPVEGLSLQRPEGEAVEMFKEVLERKGIVTTWRYTKGKDIAAACGQLALKKESPLAII
jgi:23S rRNA (adenine2503-C2)-methyltransferase